MPPYFTDLSVGNWVSWSEVYEEQPPGTYVYTVKGYNNFTSHPVVPPELTFSIESVSGDNCTEADYWCIDSKTGELSFKL